MTLTATCGRFHDAVNTGDAELNSKTIDQLVEPDELPLTVAATGAHALKEPFATLRRAFPTCTSKPRT